jgi:diguanylate cyclase (GGDEF)-like protein
MTLLAADAPELQAASLALLDAVPDPLFVLREGVVLRANPASERLLEASSGSLVGQVFDELVPAFRERQSDRSVLELRTRDGARVPVEASVGRARAAECELVVVLLHDVRPRIEAEARLLRASTHDALTGLYNRAYLDVRRGEIEGGRRPFAAVIADVDGLKIVNDELGHDAGDRLLERAADALRAAVGEGDFAVRLGGDEFALLLLDADEPRLRAAIEQVRARVEQLAREGDGPALSLSLGGALREDDEPLAPVLKRADTRMYQDKTARRAARGQLRR